METHNRREHYRFRFGSLAQPKAELISGAEWNSPPLIGALLNLSMGGAAVLLKQSIADSRWGEDWFIRFTAADRKGVRTTLALLCRLAHVKSTSQGHVYGLQFLDIGTASHGVERSALWQFLLDKQRHSLADSSA